MLGITELRHRVALLEAFAVKTTSQAEIAANLLIETATLLNTNSETTNKNFTEIVGAVNALAEAIREIRRRLDESDDDWWKRGGTDDGMGAT